MVERGAGLARQIHRGEPEGVKRLVIIAVLLLVSANRGFAQEIPRWARAQQHDSISPVRTWTDSVSRRATWIGVATGAVTGAIAGGFVVDYIARGLCDLPRDRCGATRGEIIGVAAVGALAGSALGYLIGVMIDEERNSQGRTSDGRGHLRMDAERRFGAIPKETKLGSLSVAPEHETEPSAFVRLFPRPSDGR